MLAKLELWIEYKRKEKLSYQISSLMHGILMEQIDKEYGEILHQDGRKPFRQSVSEMTDCSFKWTICTLTQEARQQIIDILLTKEKFYMRHKQLDLIVKKRQLTETTYEELIGTYYFGEHSRSIRIRFLSPTAFKSEGNYVFMPDIRLIFQSLIHKYDDFSKATEVGGADTLEHFEKYSFIRKYHLKSVRYSLEGTWIPAFLGEITIQVRGPEQMANLAHMLAVFGEYAGIGIKCSLGMGSIQVIEEKNR